MMVIFKIVIVFFLYLNCYNVNGFWMRPLVETPVGLIRGVRSDSGEYFMFLGIPYGKVDKSNPFGVAIPHPTFINEIYDAITDSVLCIQPISTSEDTAVGYGEVNCLNLNIYVPYSYNTSTFLPVLVWFHGGSFQYGSNSRWFYGPQYLVRHNVIVVTVNYRLGPFGFLCLHTPEVPGNQGLKDQVLALRWIKRNINAFGGDQNSITFVGESAGSKSADLHVHSNVEQLFHRIIMQGGSTYTMLTDLKRDDSAALLEMANKLNFQSEDVSLALKFLKSVNPKSVAELTYKSYEFGPCVEKNITGVESFLTENPINLNIPKVKNMSVLMGYNSADQYHDYITNGFISFETWNVFSKRLESFFNFDNKTLAAVEKIVREFYIGEETVSFDVRFKLGDFDTDFGMVHPTKRIMEKYLKNDAKCVYLYLFSYVGNRNYMRGAINNSEVGALHADELGYLFDIPYFHEGAAAITPKDQQILDKMTALWTNFAKYGNPTPTVSELLPVEWKANKKDPPSSYYLNINTEMILKRSPFQHRTAFWDLFYHIYYKHQKGLIDEDYVK